MWCLFPVIFDQTPIFCSLPICYCHFWLCRQFLRLKRKSMFFNIFVFQKWTYLNFSQQICFSYRAALLSCLTPKSYKGKSRSLILQFKSSMIVFKTFKSCPTSWVSLKTQAQRWRAARQLVSICKVAERHRDRRRNERVSSYCCGDVKVVVEKAPFTRQFRTKMSFIFNLFFARQ